MNLKHDITLALWRSRCFFCVALVRVILCNLHNCTFARLDFIRVKTIGILIMRTGIHSNRVTLRAVCHFIMASSNYTFNWMYLVWKIVCIDNRSSTIFKKNRWIFKREKKDVIEIEIYFHLHPSRISLGVLSDYDRCLLNQYLILVT